MIKAIIFDVDGVITHPDFSIFIKAREEIVKFLASFDINISVDSPFFKKVYDALQRKFRDTNKVWEVYLKVSEIATKYELMTLDNTIFENNINTTVNELANMGYFIAIFSLSGKQYVYRILDKLGLINTNDIIVTREDVRPKPYPDGILRISRHLGIEPKECVYIGDHIIDAETAKNAGSYSILYVKKPLKLDKNILERLIIIREINPHVIMESIKKINHFL